MADLAGLFVSSRSAVVQAGAGTGKTHSLVTLCLHLLGGIGRAEPLPAARLWAVTFTEKAAAELKGRIRQRIDALAECAPEEVAALEPDLVGPPLPSSLWRRVRRDLGAAQIGTIHGLCAQILRRHAAAAGLDPRFQVLDEIDARQMRADSCLAAALEALEGTGPVREAARRLCAELGFRGSGRFGRGLSDELASLLASLGESGREVAQVVDATPALHAATAVAAEAEARRAFGSALDDLESELKAARLRRAPSQTALRTMEAIGEYRARGATAVAAAPPGELSQAWPHLRPLRDALVTRGIAGATGDLIRAAREAVDELLEADAQVRSGRLARDLALVAAEAQRRYRAEKARESALDFDDLTRLTRDLLANDLSVRRLEKARLGVLLVDEFQDTSRPQLELIGWLVEDGDGTAPAGSGLSGSRPIAPGKLVVVGDRKQSIYDFRGADVAGAQGFATRALADGAERFVLRASRRSRPALVELCNRLFRTALGAGEHSFETAFGDDDALSAVREPGAPGSCAELLDVRGAGVEAEAEVVSRRIALLLSGSGPERVYTAEGPRPVRGGDVAILFRRFTNLDVFRRALLKKHIPHLVFKGRGFYQAREVSDLVQLLALAVDAEDDLALLSVLRSPLGPVSDDALVLLARHAGHGLRWRAVRDSASAVILERDDAQAVGRVTKLVARLQQECDRVGPAALLEAVLAETDFAAAISGGLYGEQAVANVEKLVGFARQHELHGGNARSFVAQVRRLAGEDAAGEADADVVEQGDPHAVRLLTVHSAKGLEFPIVIVPECGALPRKGPEGVALDPDLGLAVKVRGAGWRRWGTHGNAVRDRRAQRDAAQGRRLLYVAATRARDFLILSGRAVPRTETWRTLIDNALPDCGELLRVLPDGDPCQPIAARAAQAGDVSENA
ncbi:MAG TPA: UvrD-helicase domain-containing protein, partial [Myxococcales bacterium]|nr:UvrD-helicase domain-containing protein [Myxococcales bacterium]